MKVLQTIYDLGTKSGGLSSSTYNLADALNSIGVDITVACLAPAEDDILCGERKEWIHELENDSHMGTMAFSKNMYKYLRSSDFDIYHTNGTWSFHNYYTTAIAKKRKKPFVISTHGNFYPQALSISSWKKQLAGKAWVNKDLNQASVVCATSEQEMYYLRSYGVKSPIAVIPNVILIPDYISDIPPKYNLTNRKFGFLGRLHPIKNIDKILYAWASCGNITKNASMHIYGTGEDQYESFLKNECRRLNLHNVYFEGWVDSKRKYEALSDMSVLLSPSKQENFGMSIAEALMMGTPALASLNTPWSELEQYKCGWWREDSIETIATVIEECIRMDDEDLISMGKRGRDLIINNYSANIVGRKMYSLYEWVYAPDFFSVPDFVSQHKVIK